jgi:hypothetical protein
VVGLPHDQTETLTDANITLDISDYGKTLIIPASTARTVTCPAAPLPSGFYVTVFNSGAGTIPTSGFTVNPTIAAGGYSRLVKA